MSRRKNKCEDTIIEKVAVPLLISSAVFGYMGYVRVCVVSLLSSAAAIASSCTIVWIKERVRQCPY